MTTSVYLAGAEIPEYQDRMEAAGAQHRALSFRRIYDRPGLEYVRPGVRYWLDHGLDADEFPSDHDFTEYLKAYVGFVLEHRDSLDGVMEFDSQERERRVFSMGLLNDAAPGLVRPVWDLEDGFDELVRLSALHTRLVIVGRDIHKDRRVMGLLATLSGQGMALHIHMAPNPEYTARLRPTSISTMSWNAPLRFGELVTPRGMGIQRFQQPHDEKTLALVAERAEALGLDGDKIREGDMDEGARLAIATLLRYEIVTNSADGGVVVDAETADPVVDGSDLEVRKTPTAPEPTTTMLPGLGLTLEKHEEMGDDGVLEVRDVPALASTAESYRKCDTCYLSASCPAYIPGNACAFHLPVELRTKTQIKALVDTMLEIQTSRVAFGRYAEEVNGGYPDPVVGKEMDRLMKMLETKNTLEQQRESLTLSVEANKSGGILSAIFGGKAERAAELPDGGYNATQTDAVIGEILDRPSN